MDELDEAQREALRQSLREYMRRHGIGVPRLARRISEADARKPEIPIKTLQRFLEGKMRTIDMYVGFFQTFAKTLPEARADPIKSLGKAMAELYGSRDAARFAGDHTATFRRDRADSPAAVVSEINIAADDEFCRVVERSTGARLVIYDGILVCSDIVAIIHAHDRVTKGPKHYLLHGAAGRYTGYGAEAVFQPDRDAELTSFSAQVTPLKGPLIERMARFSGGEDWDLSLLPVWDDPPAVSAPKPDRQRTGEHSKPAMPIPELKIPVPDPPRPQPPRRPAERAGLFQTLVARYKRWREPTGRRRAEAVGIMQPERGRGIIRDAIMPLPIMTGEVQPDFLAAADQADEPRLRQLVEAGADINAPDARTGLTALHLAVGRGSIGIARFLIERGATFVPDKFGRMPSVIAAECEVGDELSDYIVEAEAAADPID